jgi:N-6 DNA Methylase
MTLAKSKQRVADHGEVFTPASMVEAMLDLVKDESERIDSRFLEPACGSGNFLVPVLRRKLAVVGLKLGKSEFERHHYALFGIMCMYGINARLFFRAFGVLGRAYPGGRCRYPPRRAFAASWAR